MAIPTANVPISHIMQNVTVTVKITGLTKWKLQVWLARQLFKLAAFILSMNIDVKPSKGTN